MHLLYQSERNCFCSHFQLFPTISINMGRGWSLTIPLISWQEIAVAPLMLVSTWSMVFLLRRWIECDYYYLYTDYTIIVPKTNPLCFKHVITHLHLRNCLLSSEAKMIERCKPKETLRIDCSRAGNRLRF